MGAAFAPRLVAALARGVLDAYAEFEGRPKLPHGWEPLAWLVAEAGAGVPEDFGFVARREGELVVALRGSDSFADLISDADVEYAAPPFEAGAARCDAGAVRLYASIQKQVWDALAERRSQALRVVGHSLGGAVAALLALDLAPRWAAPLALYSFGSIRPGDWRFRRRLRRAPIEAWRIENPRDLVPHWPPLWLCYRHVGRRVRVRLPGAEGALAQHSMERYCRAVEALAQGSPP